MDRLIVENETFYLNVAEEVISIPVLYIDSLECITMTILYERILTFVTSIVSDSSRHSQRFTTYKPCSTVTEMVTRLACFNWPKNLRIVLLIDEADRLFQLDSNSFQFS